MTERYDSATAKHYAAYRPPLHKRILERAIDSSETFKSGLDFGCGTGYSTVALAEFCDHVYGIDSSRQMLDLAESHPAVSYASGTVESLERLSGRPYDIVTFAGSLFYVKSEALKRALLTVCDPAGTVIVYDFNVLMDELMDVAGIPIPTDTSDYDCNVGLSDWDELKTAANESDRISIEVSPKAAAHLVLSDSLRYDAVQRCLKRDDPFESLLLRFGKQGDTINLDADIWLKRYFFASFKGRE